MNDRFVAPKAAASFAFINQSQKMLLYVKRVRALRTPHLNTTKGTFIASISSCAWIGHCTTPATIVILSGALVLSCESTGAESKDLAAKKIQYQFYLLITNPL